MPYKDPVKQKQCQNEWYLRNKELTAERRKKNRAKNPEKKREYDRLWAKAHRKERSTHAKVYYALKMGKLVKGPCNRCGATENIQGHHHDYDKPLDVEWLCPVCHGKEHRKVKS